MKKISAILIILIFIFTLSANVFAQPYIEIEPLVPVPNLRSRMQSTGVARPVVVIIDPHIRNNPWRTDAEILAGRQRAYEHMQEVSRIFYEQSFGRLRLEVGLDSIYHFVTPPHINIFGIHHLVVSEVVAELNRRHPSSQHWSRYDSNRNSVIDGLIFLVRNGAGGTGGSIYHYNFRLGGFRVGSAMNAQFRDGIFEFNDNVNIQVHEIGHMIGLRDHNRCLFGIWRNNVLPSSLLDYMNHASKEYFNIFSRYLLGWVDPVILTASDPVREIKLYAVEEPGSGGLDKPRAVVLVPNDSGLPHTEYFIMEYRRDSMSGNPGIVLFHADAEVHRAIGSEGLGFVRQTGFLRPVTQTSEDPTRFFTAEDLFTPGDVFSPFTTPNSGFYSVRYISYPEINDFATDIPTGAFMEVVRFADDYSYVIINAGFLQDWQRLSLSTSGTHTFLNEDVIQPHSVTIKNIGDTPTGELTITLSGENSDSFELSRAIIPSIEIGGTAEFTIVPKNDLMRAVHNATVTVKGTDASLWGSFDVTFAAPLRENAQIFFGRFPQTDLGTGPVQDEWGEYGVDFVSREVTMSMFGHHIPGWINGETRYFAVKPIEWRVLRDENDELFLMSERGLKAMQYNTTANHLWYSSLPRQWLNDDFLGQAFSRGEIAALEPLNDDKIFILSRDDVLNPDLGVWWEMSGNVATRIASTTDFARATRVQVANTGAYSGIAVQWWHRPSDNNPNAAGFVTNTGSLSSGNINITLASTAVRPALKLDVSDAIFTPMLCGGFTVSVNSTPPTATVNFSPNTITNQDVIVAIMFSAPVIITSGEEYLEPTEYELVYTITFAENGIFEIEFEDLFGNVGEALTVEVYWIDRIAPIATVVFNIETQTNQDVIATITFDKDDVTIINNYGSNEKIFTENGEFTFEFIDLAGNLGSHTAIVDWIDRVAPTVELDFSTEKMTHENVIATITFSREVEITYGENYLIPTENPLVFTTTFEQNGVRTIEFEDTLGNVGESLIIEVYWIYEDVSINADFTVLRFITDGDYAEFRLINNGNQTRILHFIIAEYVVGNDGRERLVNVNLHPIILVDIYDAMIEIPRMNNNLRFMLWDMELMIPIIAV